MAMLQVTEVEVIHEFKYSGPNAQSNKECGKEVKRKKSREGWKF